MSLSARPGNLIIVPGKFIVFLLPKPFPCTTVVIISFPTTSSTFNSIAPSSINIFVPGTTSLYNSLYVTETPSSFPVTSSLYNVNFCPSFN